MGPTAPGDPGGPGFPSGPAGPGRLQMIWGGWKVTFRPLLGKAYRNWQQATDSKAHNTHACSMTVAGEDTKKKKTRIRV